MTQNQRYEKLTKQVERIQSQIDKTEKIADLLFDELHQGYKSYLIAVKITEYRSRNARFVDLFNTIHFACADSVILTIRKVLEGFKDKKNVNLDYLFDEFDVALNIMDKIRRNTEMAEFINEAENYYHNSNNDIYPQPFSKAFFRIWTTPRNAIIEAKSNYKNKIETVKQTINSMESRRNKRVAHLDKKLVTQSDTVTFQPIYSADLESVFEYLFEVIEKYLWYVKGTEIIWSNLDRNLPEQFDQLVNLIQSNRNNAA